MTAKSVSRAATTIGLLVASAAQADTALDDQALHSSVGWGQTVIPDRASVTTQAGYDGAQQEVQATGWLEARLFSQLSAFTAVTYGEETAGASRPAVGAAFQILDPHRAFVGVRLSTAYKPEGFSEPEGEIETIATLSHLFERDVARAFVAYGTDPDGRESDAEAGAGYLHQLSDRWVVGVTTRYRYAIALKDASGAKWDLIGGGVGDMSIGRWRFELLLGGGAVKTASVATGPLGLASIGIDM